MDSLVTKKELIQLLDRGNEIDQMVFETFNGEDFAFDNNAIKIFGLRELFEILIPKTTWTKQDYQKINSDITIMGIEMDNNNHPQLLLNINNEPQSFTTTTEAVTQLFTPMKLNSYIHFLLEDSEKHYDLIIHNFEYWFKHTNPNDQILIRTVVENGKYIARCFATPQYRPIDNHVLLYITAWALDRLNLDFRIVQRRINHSGMKISILSKEDIVIKGIGTLSYGFTVLNSETKERTVEFHPEFELKNLDGSTATIIIDKPITIVHRGRNMDPILNKLQEVSKLKLYITNVIEAIEIAHKFKVNDIMAFRIRQSIIDIIGKKQFKKFSEKYAEISSNNMYNLLQFFGRLNEIEVEDEDKEIKLKVLFWKVLTDHSNL